jgi:hypothetical protein
MNGDHGYQSGGTKGGIIGCAVAALFALPLSGLLTFVMSYGDCGYSGCKSPGWSMPAGLAIIAMLAALIGFTVRSLFNWVMARRRDGRVAGWPPAWALLALLALGALMVWISRALSVPLD